MSGIAYKVWHNTLLFYDADYEHRWVDAYGPNVRKYSLVDAYHPDSCTVTDVSAGVGTSAITGLASVQGGGWVFTSAANEDDGVQMQVKGEFAYFGGPYPAYFGVRFKLSDADQSDVFAGYAIQDTAILTDGCTDDIGFRVADGAAAVSFLLEKDSAETVHALGAISDDTYVTVELVYDGAQVTYYVDGVEAGSASAALPNFPDDEHMAPALAFLTGDAGADTMTVKWARWIQILE